MASLLLVPGLWAQSGSLDTKINSQKSKLKQIEEDIKKHRTQAKQLQKEKASVLEQVAYLDQEIALSTKYLTSLLEQEELLEARVSHLRASVSNEGEALEYQKELLARRLRQMYMQGPTNTWEVILGSASVQDAIRRSKFMGLIAERDAHFIEQVQEKKLGLEREQAAITETLADLANAKAARLQENARLESSKKTRVAMLNTLSSEEAKHAKAIDELNRSKERLKNLIDELERRRLAEGSTYLPTGDFAKLKGQLLWPVEGPVVKKFGKDRHPQFGTVTFNNGIDIKAPAGAPIRSAAAGKVEFVDWIDGYGNCIILNHGGGYYTLYAHVAQVFVSPGENVAPNHVIAEVGDSGSPDGYECHFEVRKSKQALNPMEWLRK